MAGAMGLAVIGVRAVATSGGDMAPPVGIAILLTAGALGWATAAAGVRLAQAGGRVAAPAWRDAALPEAAPGGRIAEPGPAAGPFAVERGER